MIHLINHCIQYNSAHTPRAQVSLHDVNAAKDFQDVELRSDHLETITSIPALTIDDFVEMGLGQKEGDVLDASTFDSDRSEDVDTAERSAFLIANRSGTHPGVPSDHSPQPTSQNQNLRHAKST
eukprot:COSAG01_NODE_958_length_12470_cov_52.097729_8_plen_124_part_00